LLQLDAHADSGKHQESPLRHASVARRIAEICPDQVGIRSMSKEEADFFTASKIKSL